VTRVALFAAGLAGAFLAALALGKSLDVEARTVAAEAEHASEMTAAAPAGLSVEQDGYRLVPDRSSLHAGRSADYGFRIVGSDGETVRSFEVEHERRLHLIVAGRDGSFLHLHPAQLADGSWTAALTLPRAGSYRVFADFTTGGVRRTLGVDLAGTGSARHVERRIPAYDVALDEDGERLEFRVTRKGRPVRTQPYLGAGGHLVVLREGDLAYVHAHAEEDELAFDVRFPSDGRYRLYLQFKVGGRVETARFEVER
jgi:hypothetical protein